MATKVQEYVDDLWWLFVLQGVTTMLFGIVALFIPSLTLALLVVVTAIYAIVLGIIELIHGFTTIGKDSSWWFSLLAGAVLLGVGVYLVRNPLIALGSFIIIVGTLVLVRGIFDLIRAAFFSEQGEHRWLLAFGGVLGVVAGIILWNNPVRGGLAFVWALGLYALITGTINLAHALQIRGALKEMKDTVNGVVAESRSKPSRTNRAAHGR